MVKKAFSIDSDLLAEAQTVADQEYEGNISLTLRQALRLYLDVRKNAAKQPQA